VHLKRLMVSTSLSIFIKGIEDDTLFEKNYLAKDIGTVASILYAAPNNIHFQYSTKGSGIINRMEFIFKGGTVHVKEIASEQAVVVPAGYAFGEDKFQTDFNVPLVVKGTDLGMMEYMYFSNRFER